jgi:threonine synthase
MMGWQAAGAAPIVLGHAVDDPQTVASAIRIGNPASWRFAEAARDESGGAIQSVTDEEILEAYRLLAQEEGIFCEPASAACVAGLLKHASTVVGKASLRDARVVCIITGHGLKDPETALGIETQSTEVDADIAAVEAATGLG